MKENQLMVTLKHPKIVGVYASYFSPDEDTFVGVTELCEYGSLFEFFKKRRTEKKKIPEEIIHVIMIDLLEAIKHVHSKNWLHRDMKSDNVFVSSDGHVKLGDFGTARPLNPPKMDFSGTDVYMSPEMFKDFTAYAATDLWGIGIILLEGCGVLHDIIEDFKNVRDHIELIPSMIHESYSDELKAVIIDLLKEDYRNRPTSTDLLDRVRLPQDFDREAELKFHFSPIDKTAKKLQLSGSNNIFNQDLDLDDME